MYFNSSEITVMPAARKSADISRLTTEQTIANIVKSIGPQSDDIAAGSFIIGMTEADANGESYIEFFIEGYYVKVPWSQFKNMNDVYAKCMYADTSAEIKELKGENGDVYEGIQFSSSALTAPCFQIKKDGAVCTSSTLSAQWAASLNKDYQPWFAQIAEPTEDQRKMIWIDINDVGSYSGLEYPKLKIYLNGKWTTIGSFAV